jgi:hypothetical protein
VPRTPNIDWSYEGAPDPIAGTGANWLEHVLMWLAGLSGAGLMIFLAHDGYVAWTWLQTAIAAVLGFDLIGGAVALNLNSAKRFYHSPPQESERGAVRFMKGPLYLPATHVHPILVYLLYKPDEYMTGIAVYLAAAVSVAVVRIAPLYLARPLAVAAIVASTIAAIYVLPLVPGFEWLVPVLFLKLVLGFGVREEPYRPWRARSD